MDKLQIEKEALWYSSYVTVKEADGTEYAEVAIDTPGGSSYTFLLGLPALESLRKALNEWRRRYET